MQNSELLQHYPRPQLSVILKGFHGLRYPTNHRLFQLVSVCVCNSFMF
ncbi:unnamed protein product [Brassica oleracea var. botrytis]